MQIDHILTYPGPAPSTTPQSKESVVGRLPVELLLHIFSRCEHGIKPALRLSHTCQHWRSITLHTASLWTKVNIRIKHNASERAFNGFISLLSIQIDRTAQLLLDVFWYRHGFEERNYRVEHFIRQKAPFSRWRTLTVRFEYGNSAASPQLAPDDAFTNLESLVVLPSFFNTIFKCIERTATSKFRTLDLSTSGISDQEAYDLYKNMFTRPRHLILSNNASLGERGPVLPGNVVELEATRRSVHLFPHVQSYKLARCIFVENRRLDLGQLTSLIVDNYLLLQHRTHVLLPSLQYLECGTIILGVDSTFDTPELQTLHIRAVPDPSIIMTHLTSGFQDSIFHTGYLLSPKHSVRIGLCLSQDSNLRLLERAPEAKVVSLCFHDEGGAIGVLEHIAGSTEDVRYGTAQNKRLCPGLAELRLTCLWEGCEAEGWKKRVEEVMERRGYEGGPLKIHISRKI